MWLILLKLRWCCPKFSLHLGVETVRCIACRKCALNRKSLFLIFCLNNRHSATLRRSYTRLSTKKVNRNPRMHRRVIWLSYMPPPALYLTVHITTSSTVYSFSSDLTKRSSSSLKEPCEDWKFIHETRCSNLRGVRKSDVGTQVVLSTYRCSSAMAITFSIRGFVSTSGNRINSPRLTNVHNSTWRYDPDRYCIVISC